MGEHAANVNGAPVRPASDPPRPEDWPAVLDGALMRTGEALIPATDEGLVRGDGAFDALLVRDGRPFARAAHLDRLGRSCRALRLPFPRAEVERDVDLLLTAAPPGDAAIRIILTRGGRRLVLLESLGDPAELTRPARLHPVIYEPTVLLDGVKTLSYAANMLAGREAVAAGCDEALLVRPDGTVLEGPTCSIFWARGGRLRTPALTTGILDSVTRRVIMAGLPVDEGEYPLADLLAADEAFLASTGHFGQPITAVGDAVLPAAPGELTLKAQDVLQRAMARGEPA